MWILVVYDIREQKRLTKVAKVMEGYGQLVQYSIFECRLEPWVLRQLQNKILDLCSCLVGAQHAAL